ncbi:MAG: C2 family cysteine protease [Candidatus Thiodiazotropha sp.]
MKLHDYIFKRTKAYQYFKVIFLTIFLYLFFLRQIPVQGQSAIILIRLRNPWGPAQWLGTWSSR